MQKRSQRPQQKQQQQQLQQTLERAERERITAQLARSVAHVETLTAQLRESKTQVETLRLQNEVYAQALPRLTEQLNQAQSERDAQRHQHAATQMECHQWKTKHSLLLARVETLDKHESQLQRDINACKEQLERKQLSLTALQTKWAKLQKDSDTARVHHTHELSAHNARFKAANQKWAAQLQRINSQHAEALEALAKVHREQLEAWRVQQQQSQQALLEKVAQLETQLKHKSQECQQLESQQSGWNTMAQRASLAASLQRAKRALEAKVHAMQRELTQIHVSRDTLQRKLMSAHQRATESHQHQKMKEERLPPPREHICHCLGPRWDELVDSRDVGIQADDEQQNNTSTDANDVAEVERLHVALTEKEQILTRLRELHAAELKVQAATFKAMLTARHPTHSTA